MMGLTVLMVVMNRGYRGLFKVVGAREKVFMVDLTVLMAMLVMVAMGYKGLFNVMMTRRRGYFGLDSFASGVGDV